MQIPAANAQATLSLLTAEREKRTERVAKQKMVHFLHGRSLVWELLAIFTHRPSQYLRHMYVCTCVYSLRAHTPAHPTPLALAEDN